MLVSKKYKQGDIVAIKLISGEEVIASVSALTDTSITLSKIMMFAVGVNPQTGEQGLTLQPAAFGIEMDQTIDLELSKTLWISLAANEAKKAYINLTSSIKMANSNDVASLSGIK